jgi:hypothetical protein
MENLKFKKDAEPIGISEDFFYMISGGGWCKPEVYLEEEIEKFEKAEELVDEKLKQIDLLNDKIYKLREEINSIYNC